jgi:hypothetical protein
MDEVSSNVTDNSTVQQVQQPANRSQFHKTRALVAYLDDQEKRNLLLGRPVLPGEDLTQIEQRIEQYNNARTSRANYSPTNPIVSDDDPILDIIRTRPEIAAAFDQLGLPYRSVMIDLKQVLSYQSIVRIDNLDERVTAATKKSDALLELCFPTTMQIEASMEMDGQGYTLTTSNPNLSLVLTQIPIPVAVGQIALTPAFVPQDNTGFLNVVHYQGRYFIRDGYHRAVSLIRNNTEPQVIVPCIIIEAQTLNQTGWRPGMIAEAILLSNNPPHLSDFWDDTISCELLRQSKRKIFRVRLDVFEIPLT